MIGSFRVQAQEIISGRSITSWGGSVVRVNVGHANNFILTASCWDYDNLLFADSVMIINDTNVNSDLYRHHILVDRLGNYKEHFQSARVSLIQPRFVNGEYLMTGRYPGYVTGLEIGGQKFEQDSFYAANSIYTMNAYACVLDTQLWHLKSLNFSTTNYADVFLTAFKNGYYLKADIASEMKWNGDSLNTLEIDSLSQSFSFLAKLDRNFQFVWRKYLFGLTYDYDPQIKSTRKATVSDYDMLYSDDENILLFGSFGDGVEYDGDTLVLENYRQRSQAICLLIDSSGSFLKLFKFAVHLESDHLDAVTNGQGTSLHFVGYKEPFNFKGVNYPWGRYFVFYDDTLGIKRIINNPYAQAIAPASDGSFYWTGQVKQNATFGNFNVLASDNKPKIVVAKISPQGEYLWVKVVNGGMEMNSIAENNKGIACIGRAYQHITYKNDTLIKLASDPFKTSGLLILEDQHVLGEEEVVNKVARLNVYPNPSNNSFTLEWVFEEAVELSVYDLSGRKIFTKTALDQSDQLRFSPDNSGVYFIQIQDGKQSLTRKIVKL